MQSVPNPPSNVVLASASTIRTKILAAAGVPHGVEPAQVDEDEIKASLRLEGAPAFEVPPGEAGWRLRALEALARSLLDGLAVWGRELRRPEDERSPTILRHEAERSQRLADCWEEQIDDPLMQGPFNMAQLTLICALDLEIRNPHFRWRDGRPRLAAWADRLAQRPSLAATVPPPIL